MVLKNKFQHQGYVWGFFKRILKDEMKSKIRGMRLFSSMDGCVFDYPEEGHEIFEEILYNDRYYGTNYTLEIIEDLPELLNIDEQRNYNNSNNNITLNGYRPNYNNHTNHNNHNNNNREFNNFDKGNFNHMRDNNKINNVDHSKYNKKGGRIDLFVGNLPFNIDEKQFREFFEKNGLKGIEFDARIALDKETGKPRGFGFVSVFNKNDVSLILKCNGKEFLKRKLIINESKK